MKIAAAILGSIVVVVVAWAAAMWICIYVGGTLYPENIHNAISLCGVIFVGPLAGIVTAVFACRYIKKLIRANGQPIEMHITG
jgi:hypothetical protein